MVPPVSGMGAQAQDVGSRTPRLIEVTRYGALDNQVVWRPKRPIVLRVSLDGSRSVKRLVTAFAVAVLGASTIGLSAQARGFVRGGSGTSTSRVASPTVVASWVSHENYADGSATTLLVLWRGTPGWFSKGGRGGGSGGGSGAGRSGSVRLRVCRSGRPHVHDGVRLRQQDREDAESGDLAQGDERRARGFRGQHERADDRRLPMGRSRAAVTTLHPAIPSRRSSSERRNCSSICVAT